MKELDCRGLACPEPVIRCRAALGESPRPETVRVIVDNGAALENVSRFLHRHGYATAAENTGSAEKPCWEILGTLDPKLAAIPLKEEGTPGVGPKKDVSYGTPLRKTLILLTTETLGHGDDELGAKLMDNFLATLPELGPELGEHLWRVILLNGGVKLSARPGKALDSLKLLEASGVGVLVCGACLNHFGLLEAKAVGETTNMLDVVTCLGVADKVIRP